MLHKITCMDPHEAKCTFHFKQSCQVVIAHGRLNSIRALFNTELDATSAATTGDNLVVHSKELLMKHLKKNVAFSIRCFGEAHTVDEL